MFPSQIWIESRKSQHEPAHGVWAAHYYGTTMHENTGSLRMTSSFCQSCLFSEEITRARPLPWAAHYYETPITMGRPLPWAAHHHA